MTTPRTGRRLLALFLVALASTFVGCKNRPKMDIPTFPGSAQSGGLANVETEEGTLFRLLRRTPDGLNTVAEYYRKELVEGRGWTESYTVGPTFSDGNLKVTQPGGGHGIAEPLDETITGGFVVIYEGHNATHFELLQYVPKPAK